MAQRGIREADAKRILAKYLPEFSGGKITYHGKVVLVTPETDMEKLPEEHPWLLEENLVAKPDQLFGKRGKHGLVLLNASWDEVKKWIGERMNKEVTIGRATGKLTHFLVEPFTPHSEDEEYYVAIKDARDHDTIFFSLKGGIFVEENWDKVLQIPVPIDEDIEKALAEAGIDEKIPEDIPADKREKIVVFIKALYRLYANLGFTYLEINPFTFDGDGNVVPLDLVARLDDTAAFECGKYWGDIEFPPPFGRTLTPEEKYIKEMDEKSGASLKLTILNPKGRVWTMVAGGGASVIYADTVVDLGFGEELANYGEYSGNPTTDETYEYARTILDLMTREKDPRGKILIIGGGIANFTDVAKTFTGIIKALEEYAPKLKEHNVKIYVRRGGPNYKEGLRKMKEAGERLGLDIQVYGPETHMTRIVRMALVGEKTGEKTGESSQEVSA